MTSEVIGTFMLGASVVAFFPICMGIVKLFCLVSRGFSKWWEKYCASLEQDDDE